MSWDSLLSLARMTKRGQGQLAGSRVSQEMGPALQREGMLQKPRVTTF